MEFKDKSIQIAKEIDILSSKNSKGKSILDDKVGKSKRFNEYKDKFMQLDKDTQNGVLSSKALSSYQKDILKRQQQISSTKFNIGDLNKLSKRNTNIENNLPNIISALKLDENEEGVTLSEIKSAADKGDIDKSTYTTIKDKVEKSPIKDADAASPEAQKEAKKGLVKSKIGEVLDNPAAQLGIAVTATYALKEGIESLATRGGFLNDLFGIDDNFLHNLDDLNESATNTKQIADNAKADITTMENAQTSTQSRINQLMSIKDPTADQQAELKGLQGQNAELQRGIALKKQMSENLNKDATQHAMDLFEDVTVTDITKKTNNPMLQGVSDKSSLTDGARNEIKYIQDKQAALKKLEEQQAKAADDPDKQKEFGKQITAVTKDIDEAYTSLNEKMESINANAPSLYNDDGSIKEGAQNIVKEVTDVQSAYDYLVLDPEDANKNDVERFFNSSGMDTIKARLMELGQEGQVGVSKLNEEFPGLIASLEESGIKTKDAIKYFNDLGRSAGEAGQQMELMKDPLEAYEEALQTENAGDDYLKIAQGLDQTKALADQGLVGTDDFKTFAKMISPDGKDDKESFYKNYEKLKSFDMESEGGRENLLKKLQEKDPGYASFDKKTGTWSVDIENTAKAADQLGIAVAPLEAMLGRLQDYGSNVNFTSMVDQFNEAQTAVGGLKELAGSMDEGAEKDALMADISNYEKQINAAKNDLSTLPPELVTELKFRYSREQMKQEIAEAQNQVNFSGNVATGQNLANHSALASKQQVYMAAQE